MAQKKRPYDFFINVAKLNITIQKMKCGSLKHLPAELVAAEMLVSELKQNDLFCEEAVVIGRDPSKEIRKTPQKKPTKPYYYPTLDDPVEGRPLLISGGSFEMNRQRH